MAETDLEKTVSEGLFDVDPVLCIACDACCQDFPEVFFMGDDEKAHPLDDQQATLYNARTVIDVCPTDAITFSGEVPPPELTVELVEVAGWEAEWALYRDVPENKVERDRRYGRDYEVHKKNGYIEISWQWPTRVPAVRDCFRFDAPAEMPEYQAHVYRDGDTVRATCWVPRISPTDKTDVRERKAKILALTHTSSSFPARFTVEWELPNAQIIGMRHRYDALGKIRILAFTDADAMANHQWESHFITEECTACSICERVCPTNAISAGERYMIDPSLCINCSVCGVYCPFDAIDDNDEVLVAKIKPKQVPKAYVIEDLCTGCEFCVDVCPFEALEMVPLVEGSIHPLPQTSQIAAVIDKNCVSCKLCEQVCIKDAVQVPRPHQFEDIGMSFMSYLTDDH